MSDLNKLFDGFEVEKFAPQKFVTTGFTPASIGNGALAFINEKDIFGKTIFVDLPAQNNGFLKTKMDGRLVFAYRIDLTTETGYKLYDHLKEIDYWIENVAFKEALKMTQDQKLAKKFKDYKYISMVSSFESDEEKKNSKTLWIKFSDRTNFLVEEEGEPRKIILTDEFLEKDKLRGNYRIRIGIIGIFANNISKQVHPQVFMKSAFLEKGKEEKDEFLENIMRVKNLKLKEEKEPIDLPKDIKYEDEEDMEIEDKHEVEELD
uniref:Uncharacterized protein n=1 Tax=viral metagenome TaxID=1070528 RepID=A0A6C0J831_9ZZZZ